MFAASHKLVARGGGGRPIQCEVDRAILVGPSPDPRLAPRFPDVKARLGVQAWQSHACTIIRVDCTKTRSRWRWKAEKRAKPSST